MRKGRKKDYIYSPFHASRQMSSEFLGSGELVHMAIPSEGKHHNPKYPSLLLPTLPFMADLSVCSHVDTFILNIPLIPYLLIYSCLIKKTLPFSLFNFC